MMPKVLASSWTWVRQQPWPLWRTQLWAVMRREFKSSFSLRRSGWIYALAVAPAIVILLHAVADRRYDPLNWDTEALAWVVEFYFLRLAVFFGALGIYLRLIRGKMVDRSLHYLLLAPIRREVLLVGEFLAGAVTVLAIFETAILLTFAAMYGHHGAAGAAFVFSGPGLRHLADYLLIVGLAGTGYGAVFLFLSMVFKNPTPSAMLVMLWEVINPVFPSLLQKISIASYVRHLMPVSVQAQGFLALLMVPTEPVRPWAAVVGVLCVTVAVLAFSCFRMRRLQINYSVE